MRQTVLLHAHKGVVLVALLCGLVVLSVFGGCVTVLERELAEEHYNLGNIYYELEEYDRAVEQYNKAISIDNTILRTNYNLALAHIGAGRYEQALMTLLVLLDDEPDNPLVVETIAFVHYQLGDSEAAIEWNDRILELIPNKPSALYNTGVILYSEDDIVMALQYLEMANQFENNNAEHIYTLLLMYEELDQLLAADDSDVEDDGQSDSEVDGQSDSEVDGQSESEDDGQSDSAVATTDLPAADDEAPSDETAAEQDDEAADDTIADAEPATQQDNDAPSDQSQLQQADGETVDSATDNLTADDDTTDRETPTQLVDETAVDGIANLPEVADEFNDGDSGDSATEITISDDQSQEDESEIEVPLTEQLLDAPAVDITETHRLELARQLLHHDNITDVHRLYLGILFTQLNYFNEALTAYQAVTEESESYGAARYFTAEVELLHIDQPRSGLVSLNTALESGYRDLERFIALVNHEPLLQRDEIVALFNANDVDVAQ